MFVIWFAISVFVFALNSPSPPASPVDAVIVLGGSAAERLPVAQSAAADLQAPLLAVSQTDTPGNAASDALCRQTTFPSQSLVCFRPAVLDTRGEAVVIGKLAEANGWTSIAVVTSTYHMARAETLIRQCASVEVHMLASKPKLDSLEWLRRFIVETGGLLDANLSPECD